MEWPDGRVYIGGFENDLRSGYGEFIFADGGCYRGEFLDNRQHGHGTLFTLDGMAVPGVWAAGKLLRLDKDADSGDSSGAATREHPSSHSSSARRQNQGGRPYFGTLPARVTEEVTGSVTY